MRPVYGILLAIGFVGLVVWAISVYTSESVEGWESFNLDRRLGSRGRRAVASVLGFGMAGLSASYAGWNAGLALVAALAGAAVGVALAGQSNLPE